MKTKKIYFFLCSLLAPFVFSTATAQDLHPKSNSIDPSWSAEAQKRIELLQYRAKPTGREAYVALNPKNKTVYKIGKAGYEQTFMQDVASHNLRVAVNALNGKAISKQVFRSVAVSEGTNIDYRYQNLTVQYQNSAEGLRQNFIVHSRENAGAILSLELSFKSDLSLQLNEDKKGIALLDAGGKTIYHYDGLKAWDAEGKILPAVMRLSNDHLTIEVAAKDALYPVTVDPLNHAPSWTDNGNGLLFPLLNDLATPVMYGYSVSSAGDVNGDGYGDVIIGAPTYVDIISVSSGTFNAASVGAAFIYYGSASGLSANPSEVLQPTTQAGALFGFSVSKAGDVNGDGYADVVVGAPGDHINLNIGLITPVSTSVAVGKAYVYYGGPAGTFDGNVATEPTASVQLSLTQADFGMLSAVPLTPLYGFSVGEAGDVNGDGKGDILVGSPGYTQLLPVPLKGGRVDVYHGAAAGISATPARTITGSLLNALFGYSVSTAGKVNGDNYADIIVGAPGSLAFLGAGQAFVFHGSTSGISATTTAGANKALNSGGLLTTLYGFSVSNAGDVNGDGYSDVIVGEPAALDALLTQVAAVGAVYIYYGTASGITTSGATTLRSPKRPSVLGIVEGNLLFGFSVSAAGDVNCDGYADVVIGEPGGTALSLGSGLLNVVSTNALSGRGYVYYGATSKPLAAPSYIIEQSGTVSLANLIGHSVADAGDVNGDGKADLLIGAPNGTLNLSGGILPALNSALNIITANSIGSSYLYQGCLPTQGVLPVSLLSFAGQKKVDKVELTWKVETESGLNDYEVQRSSDGKSFTTIGLVLSTGSRTETGYRFQDGLPLLANYYRLKMVHHNGSIRYSTIVQISFENNNATVLKVSPNPVHNQFTVSTEGFAKGTYRLSIANASGNSLMTKTIIIDGDAQTQLFQKGMLSAGVYFLNIYSESGLLAKTRFILQ